RRGRLRLVDPGDQDLPQPPLADLGNVKGGGPGVVGEILTGLEQRGPVGGLAREAFSPSLMSGLAGVLHTLLRMHPAARLPDPLLLD
ncbi:hypothetical protein AB0I84_50220, partial [Streptomyces spectabilis]|uniref:hypothetical protein n=1 Tax=Streptomyces spectabilis TaxID=68270 RepID=UPI0033C8C28E